MIIMNGTPNRRGFFLSLLLSSVVLSGFESNTPMPKVSWHVVDEVTSKVLLVRQRRSATLSAPFLVFHHHAPPPSAQSPQASLINNPTGMATDNQVALSRPTGGSPPKLSKEARKVVPAFLQKLFQ